MAYKTYGYFKRFLVLKKKKKKKLRINQEKPSMNLSRKLLVITRHQTTTVYAKRIQLSTKKY